MDQKDASMSQMSTFWLDSARGRTANASLWMVCGMDRNFAYCAGLRSSIHWAQHLLAETLTTADKRCAQCDRCFMKHAAKPKMKLHVQLFITGFLSVISLLPIDYSIYQNALHDCVSLTLAADAVSLHCVVLAGVSKHDSGAQCDWWANCTFSQWKILINIIYSAMQWHSLFAAFALPPLDIDTSWERQVQQVQISMSNVIIQCFALLSWWRVFDHTIRIHWVSMKVFSLQQSDLDVLRWQVVFAKFWHTLPTQVYFAHFLWWFPGQIQLFAVHSLDVWMCDPYDFINDC